MIRTSKQVIESILANLEMARAAKIAKHEREQHPILSVVYIGEAGMLADAMALIRTEAADILNH